MKFKFGKTSQGKLYTVHPNLEIIMEEALDTGIMDFSIIEGHRAKGQQNRYYDLGKSKVKWPDGKHNKIPSDAVDAAPWINKRISWNKFHCCVLAGIILACAAKRGIKLRWGGNWDMDSEPITDQDFQDLVHYELV
jgi:peptidoglycan L-alanyl-D-glutamate endopeptidase CwlK